MKEPIQFLKNQRDLKNRPQRGFSLIVTITMMILLSLIAVGLLSLSSVTLRAAGSEDAMREAQANARLALTLALGELQELAGPDQRITAAADIAGDEAGDMIAAGADPQNNNSLDSTEKGLTAVQPGTRYWTGVFTNNDDPSRIYSKTPSSSLQGWLVSNPTGTVNTDINPSNSAYSANADGSASNPEEAIVLVGNNTFGNGNNPDNYVTAPLVTISDGTTQTGSYAWWIGDENVKSLINQSNQQTQRETFASLSPQRRGWEIVEGISNYPEATDDAQNNLDSLLTMPSSELLIGDVANVSGTESLFHSATAYSSGLHTNSLEGGLKVDLTSALENGLSASNSDSPIDNFPSRDNPIIPAEATSDPLDLLTWDRIDTFYQKIKTANSTNELTVGVDTVAEGGSAYAIAPTIIEFRLALGARAVGQTVGRTTSSTSVTMNPCGKVLFAIANPYSQTLRWDSDLEFQLRHLNGDITSTTRHSPRLWQSNNESIFFPTDETADRNGSQPAVFNQAVFQISPDSLEPGEARVYTIDSPIIRNRARGASTRVNVPMAPMSETDLDDFTNCIEMTTTATHTLPKSFDVREQTNTSLIDIEMRLGDETLRRISGFELNNTAWRAGETQKRFTEATTAPVPLLAFRFQISQPGIDYATNFMTNGEHGQRASALRTFADFNLQASHYDDPITSYTPPPFFFRRIDSHSQINGQIPDNSGLTGSGFTEGLFEDPLPWGYSNIEGSDQTILYTIPEALSSLAQLQHLDLTNDNTKVSIAHQPAYAVGNSYATPFVRRALTEQARTDYRYLTWGSATQTPRNYYDLSYLLNASLWDRFFLSTLDDTQEEPLNPNQILLSDEARDVDPEEVAGHVINRGSFNVNSTSISAWKAFLASSRDLFNQENPSGSNKNSFPRSLQHLPVGIDNPTGSDDDSFAGNRMLSDAEIDLLAREIVRQVRIRGPFVSFSQFVNRTLVDPLQEPELSGSGLLQYALEETGININAAGTDSPFTQVDLDAARVAYSFNGNNPRPEVEGNTGTVPASAGSDPDWGTTGSDRNHKSLSSIVADRELATNTRRASQAYGSRFASIPAWVNQADLLQFLAPSMSVRSDTFRIRTCGRSHDPSGNVVAVAYAEAIVERTPDFVDQSDPSNQNPENLSLTNQRFGRRFSIVGFRWLKENEI